jgi:hypothetical protein
VADRPRYHCNDGDTQGIQRGWSDLYPVFLPCQWIDITGVPDGEYTLTIELDPDGRIEEIGEANNTVSVPLTLGDPDLETPSEPCDPALDTRVLASTLRECGWVEAGVVDCPTGATASIACAPACEGTPMVRACAVDPNRPDDENCSRVRALATATVACAAQPDPDLMDIACPPTGRIRVLTGPRDLAVPAVCDVTVTPAP